MSRNFFQRIFGIPATKGPINTDCWSVENNQVLISLDKAPELAQSGGALCLEGKNLNTRILVFKNSDNQFVALENKCSHAGRKLDPLTDENQIQCCSVSKTTYDNTGKVIHGPGKHPAKFFPVKEDNGKLSIFLGEKNP